MKNVVREKPSNGIKKWLSESEKEITEKTFKIYDTSKNYALYWDGSILECSPGRIHLDVYELPLIPNQTIYDNVFDIEFVKKNHCEL